MPNNSFKCYDSFFLRHTSVTHIPMQSGTRLYIEQYDYNLIYWKGHNIIGLKPVNVKYLFKPSFGDLCDVSQSCDTETEALPLCCRTLDLFLRFFRQKRL